MKKTTKNAAIVVDQKYALDLMTSKDTTRPELTCVCANGGRACASDGRALAIVPCTGTNGHPVLIPSALFDKARRGKRFQDTCIIEDAKGGTLRAETKGGTMSVPVPKTNKPYPDIDAVFPAESKREVSVALDAELLADLQRALGGKSVVLHFTIFQHRNRPEGIRVTCPGDSKAKGLIMPMSVYE